MRPLSPTVINNFLTPFTIALQFLTRIPVPVVGQFSDQAQAQSLLYYPLVGLVIGCLLIIAPFPDSTAALSAALLLTLWTAITGGLHLDGLADSADAWAGGAADPERTLAIMKDPASGPLGVTALLLVLLIKFAGIYELVLHAQTWQLLLPPVLGRTAIILLLLSTPYVRRHGLGSKMSTLMPRKKAIATLLIVFAAIGWILGPSSFWLLSGLLATGGFLRHIMCQRIGGTTGDTLGALVEIIEATSLALLVIIYLPSSP